MRDRPTSQTTRPFLANKNATTNGSASADKGDNGSGGGIRTHDLWVMSPTSCRCSTPRRERRDEDGRDDGRCGAGCRARGPHFPGSCPPSTSPALAVGTTGFGMGPGGSPPRSLTPGTPPAHRRSSLMRSGRIRRSSGIEIGARRTGRRRRGPPPGRQRKGPPTPMRTAPLRRLPAFHARPLNPVVCRGAYLLKGRSDLSSPGGVPT